VRKNHETIGEHMTLAEFNNARQVNVSSAYSGHGLVEEALLGVGIKRHFALQIPHFAILSHVIAHSDLVAILPERVARLFESYEQVQSFEIPVGIAPFFVRIHWHKHDRSSAADTWFRNLVAEALGGL
jgi:DNA-binding transcriptional LysR family regulator